VISVLGFVLRAWSSWRYHNFAVPRPCARSRQTCPAVDPAKCSGKLCYTDITVTFDKISTMLLKCRAKKWTRHVLYPSHKYHRFILSWRAFLWNYSAQVRRKSSNVVVKRFALIYQASLRFTVLIITIIM